jgi:hypothetical protein
MNSFFSFTFPITVPVATLCVFAMSCTFNPSETVGVLREKRAENELKTGFLLDLVYEGLVYRPKPSQNLHKTFINRFNSYKSDLSTFENFINLTKLNETLQRLSKPLLHQIQQKSGF